MSYSRRLKRDLLGDTKVLGVSRGERKGWILLFWRVSCLFYLHVQPSCGYGESDRCLNRVHVWCPCLCVRYCFPSQVEGEVASSCVCLCEDLSSECVPSRASEKKVLDSFLCLATYALVRFRCSNPVEVSVESCHSRSELCQYARFSSLEIVVQGTSVFAWQCCVHILRVFTYPFRECLVSPLLCYLNVYCCGLGPW